MIINAWAWYSYFNRKLQLNLTALTCSLSIYVCSSSPPVFGWCGGGKMRERNVRNVGLNLNYDQNPSGKFESQFPTLPSVHHFQSFLSFLVALFLVSFAPQVVIMTTLRLKETNFYFIIQISNEFCKKKTPFFSNESHAVAYFLAHKRRLDVQFLKFLWKKL